MSNTLDCPYCPLWFSHVGAYRNHLKIHPKQRPPPPPSPPDKLLSRRSSDPNDGVYDFCHVLDDVNEVDLEIPSDPDSEVDSYFSDANYERSDDDNSDDDNSTTPNASGSIEPYEVGDVEYDHNNDNDESDNNDNREVNGDEASDVSDEVPADYFIGGNVPDDQVPFSENIYSPINNFSPPTSFVTQIRLQELFHRNKGSLKMYDEVITIINAYTSASDFSPYDQLIPRKAFLSRMEEIFETQNFKPSYGSVRLHNGTNATVPVFDIKYMILSILHDDSLMIDENFADGLDIFTGKVDNSFGANDCYGEYHTGDAWMPAMERFCGTEGKYMPFGIIIFGDKSNTDQHGALSVTPITFTATFFNKGVRNNPNCWRPIAYLPNLAYGNDGCKPVDKVQDEHNCLAFAFKSLIDLSEEGGIRTEVMGRMVIVKPFIHVFIGDTEGHNKWLGHYQGSKPGMGRPYRDCHCKFDDLDSANPECTYTVASEFRRAIRLVVRNSGADKNDKKQNEWKKKGYKLLKSMSRHCVHNALYQSKLPLSDMVHGANRMCPPESLHVMDAGITMYMQESLESRISKGRSMAELDSLQNRMFHAIRRSSERDFPRGTTRSGIVGTTRCQSSERKGNLFLLLCVAHTADGRLILQFELDYSKKQYDRWLDLLKLYLAMEEWFHDARDKEEVELARELVADIITQVQEYFPRTEDSHGYKLPKMHALAKMIDYICLYGSAINFYGGPGEASHKSFVKAPGLKTQRRVSEFAAQVAGQYYNMMVTRKACNYVDIGLTSDRVDETNYRARNNSKDEQYSVEGRYTVDIFADGSIRLTATKNKSLKKHGLHMVLVRALRKLATDEGNTGAHRFEGYTRATVKGNDGESATYNAHPHFHGGPWYDWAYVYYEIETEFETVAEYYPSKIFGFIKDESDDVHAIIQCSKKHLPWDQVEEEFVVKFELCSEEGSEQIVPLSALNNPICVVQDYGSNNADDYLMILPKGQWSEYFGSWVHD